MLLLVCTLLLVTGIGTTTDAVLLDLEKEEELDVLTVDSFVLTMVFVGIGATTIVVLDEDDAGGDTGLDKDVLLGGAGATVGVLGADVLEADVLTGATECVLEGELDEESELAGGAAAELLAVLVREVRVEEVL